MYREELMSSKKTSSHSPKTVSNKPTAPRKAVVVLDPADKYYERSRKDWEDYDRAVNNTGVSAEYLAEQNHEAMGAWGNGRSRQGFDPRTFRHR
jgi:hypothetical protein